jgi:hypothetical protein
MSDQCALDESGSLREARDIEFFFSESETTPLPSSAASSQQNPHNAGKSHIFHCLFNFNVAMSQVFDVVNERRK